MAFTGYFLEELTYLKRPLEEFLSSRRYKGEFQMVVEDKLLALREEKQGVLNENLRFLKGEEQEYLKVYFYEIGKGDSLSQKEFFSSQKAKIFDLQKECEILCKKYGDLYVKLGLLCGLALLLLII